MTIAIAYPQVLSALCIWREARGESLAAKLGVWWVLRNRSTDPAGRWPTDIVKVITQPKQFSSFNTGDPNAVKFPGIADAAWLDCCAVVESSDPDPTGSANHYHSLTPATPWPNWADPAKLTVTIGPFKFYRL